MTKKELEAENEVLKGKLKLAMDLASRLKNVEQPPAHLACGIELLPGVRVYGTKESIESVKNFKQAFTKQAVTNDLNSKLLAELKNQNKRATDNANIK